VSSPLEVRSFRSVFALERRIYRIDTLRLNPSGIPLRGIGYAASLVAAALIAGTGAATIALAHNAVPSAVPQAGTTSATTGTGAAAPAHGSGGPQVTHSVATTSGSGVTMTTTTHTANGKTVISRTRHAAPHSDN